MTGLGLVTPLGNNLPVTWQHVIKAESGIRQILKWGDLHRLKEDYNLPDNFPFMAGEIADFDLRAIFSHHKQDVTREDVKRINQTDPFVQYACAASLEAVTDAGFVLPLVTGERVGVVIGSGQGGTQTWEAQFRRMLAGKRLSPFAVPRQLANLASGNVSIILGARGMNLCPATACAAGAHAIGLAFRAIQFGYSDIVIAGGAEAAITPLNVYGFHSLKALSTRNASPEEASRPFDRDRDGFVMAEGAGIVVLESLESAHKRGARIYAEIIGYAETADSHHITEPNVLGAISSMKLALRDAEILPGEVDLINAHATSTPIGDANEAKAIIEVFGRSHSGPIITANKSQIGHPLGAAGAIESVLTILSMKNNLVPSIVNFDSPSGDCEGLNYVIGQSRQSEINIAISNSFGFGGTNACLVFREVDE